MLFQIYGSGSYWQLLGWVMVFVGLILVNEIARRTKLGGILTLVILPAALTVYFIAIYMGAASGADWALNNPTYIHMNSWFHYAKLYAATIGCIGFMMLKYKWSIGKTEWFKDLHRSHRIILSRTSCIDLKCEILVRISSIYMRDHVSSQLIKSLILY